jgi:hypothetical protein
MRVVLKIKAIETRIRATELRSWLSWSAVYVFGIALLVLLVFLITGTFGR